MSATILFFWDYDTQWGADRPRGLGGPKQWGYAEFENTERLLELHALYDVPACFAVVGAAALPGKRPYHDPDQVRRIHENGHEVASHSFRHEWLPGIGWQRLLRTVRDSKDALEQCIGASVVTFVPPYNQPFDCPRRLSFSLSERLSVRSDRIDLARLCRALSIAGYTFCRVAYRSIGYRLLDRIVGRPVDGMTKLESIHGISCIRVNTSCGFGADTLRSLRSCGGRNGILVLYGHPHSLTVCGPQHERWLKPLLEMVRLMRSQNGVRTCVPRDLVEP
jgi:hypothetical protein